MKTVQERMSQAECILLFITHNARSFSTSTTDPAHYTSMNHWCTRLTCCKVSVSQTFPGSEEGHLKHPQSCTSQDFLPRIPGEAVPLPGAAALKVNVLYTATDSGVRPGMSGA